MSKQQVYRTLSRSKVTGEFIVWEVRSIPRLSTLKVAWQIEYFRLIQEGEVTYLRDGSLIRMQCRSFPSYSTAVDHMNFKVSVQKLHIISAVFVVEY